ncbi:MAG: phytanoyl-CoA dioxygenase family protein [Alphaproteobacteria bacterium]|nr:phytanoyl-CoA dioxygenase family protein [Alphaproteobacteria bacterium]
MCALGSTDDGLEADAAAAVDEATVAAFRADGAVCLRGVFSAAWVDLLRQGVDQNLSDPGPYGRHYTPAGATGHFFGDYCNWARIEAYRRFLLESPAAAICGRLMGARRVHLFHEHVLVKEPATTKPTPWHHDQPYWCVDGDQVMSLWVPLDPVPRSRGVEFVAGSHRWGRWFAPQSFLEGKNHAAETAFEPVPDIQAERESHRILGWDVAPGDAIAFHALTLHGAPGNDSADMRRRAFAARWFGDDARYAVRPDVISPPFPELQGRLRPGDPMDPGLFPVAWTDPAAAPE